ncbi:hypothetical protein DICA4_D35168 [Diutina catenulata]
MASKAWTVFLLDDVSAADYLWEQCAAQLLTKRKLDRLALVLAGDTLFVDGPFTYDTLRQWHAAVSTAPPPSPGLAPGLRAARANFDLKPHLKFGRELVVISSDARWDAAALDYADSFGGVGVTVVGAAASGPWQPAVAAWGAAVVEHPGQAVARHAPVRRVNPVKKECVLRIGRDAEGEGPGGAEAGGAGMVNLPVAVYPAARVEKAPPGSDYSVAGAHPVQVKRHTSSYTKEYDDDDADDDDDRGFRKVPVESVERTSAFKYSKRDVVVVSDDLAAAATLATAAGMDVLGFAPGVPWPYLTGESNYVVPRGSARAYASFVRALHASGRVAVVRYVPKDGAPVAVAALFPVELAVGQGRPGLIMVNLALKEDEKFGKFPYLTPKRGGVKAEEEEEDEFDSGDEADSGPVKLEEDVVDYSQPAPAPSKFPQEGALAAMEAFIEGHTLRGGGEEGERRGRGSGSVSDPVSDPVSEPVSESVSKPLSDPYSLPVISNPKLALAHTEPVSVEHVSGPSVDSRLTAGSPSLFKYSHGLKHIIARSLGAPSLSEFLAEPDFVAKNLVDPAKSNLFNLGNILAVNTSNEGPLVKPDLRKAQRAATELGVKWKPAVEKTAKSEQPQVKKEAEFGAFVDIDALIGE